MWALELPDHPAQIEYFPQVRAWYDALHRQHVQTDFAHPARDLSQYKLVIAPALYVLSNAAAANLRQFVANGGVLVTTPFTDIVDETDRFLPGGFATRLADVYGARVVDFDGIVPEDRLTVKLDEAQFEATLLREDVVLSSAEVIGTVASGEPALLANTFGDGFSLHLAVFAGADGIDMVTSRAVETAGVTSVLAGLPSNVEAIATDGGITLINQSRDRVQVETIDFTASLEPFEVCHLP